MNAVVRRALLCSLALSMLAGLLGLAAPAAHAAGSVSVTSSLGNATASANGPTTITVTGRGFQSVRGGFGGVYVLFGWVNGGSWQPSRGGTAGGTYLYVPDSEARDNKGYQRFVAFPGSSTSEAANGGTLADDGSWRVSMVVPGSKFTAQDRSGNRRDVDCAVVRCGIITVGAHGIANANNETFTPITFAGTSASASTVSRAPSGGSATQPAATQAGGQAAPGSGATGAQARAAGESTGAAPVGDAQPQEPAGVGVSSASVVVGRSITFAGRGFQPGEQVVASLSGGQAAAGPLVAGNAGEVAGVLSLPATIRPGTHTLTLLGAASGQSPTVDIRVIPDPVLAANAAEAGGGGLAAALIAVLIASGLLVAVMVSSGITAFVRRRRARAHAPAGRRGSRKRRATRSRRESTVAAPAEPAATEKPAPADGPHGEEIDEEASNVDTIVLDLTGGTR